MEKLIGRVKTVTFRNAENGYSVLKVTPSKPTISGNQHGKHQRHAARHQMSPVTVPCLVTVVGNLPGVEVNDQAEFSGQWETHQKFGRQFTADHYQLILPTTTDGIQAYLTSHINGIGPVYAKKIADKFGKDTTKVLEKNPEKLAKIKGITKKKAIEIGKQWQREEKLRNQLIGLAGLGISPNLSAKVIKAYEENAVETVRKNPYRLAEDIWGVGFIKADEIAASLGIKKDNPKRIEAAVKYLLGQAADDGHLYLPQQKLVEEVAKLILITEEKINQTIERLIELKELNRDRKTAVYLPLYHYAENQIALLARNQQRAETPLSRYTRHSLNFQKAFSWVAKKQGFSLNAGQKRAIQTALTNPVSILTGGPGTGKSTALKALVLILSALKKKTSLAAPTGRAAKRMAEVTEMKAKTIHRLLKIDKTGKAHYTRDNPLATDFLIIDEASMLDVILAYQVFTGLGPQTHLLLVGDDSQLPSVGPGNVLGDLISSKKIPLVKLTEIFRQAKMSAIVRNAHRINEGIFPFFPKHPTDFYFFESEDAQTAADLIVDLVSHRIGKNFHLNPLKDIQVLAPMHKTACGVSILNQKLQQELNPPRSKSDEIPYGNRIYRVKDRVMQISNNYEKEVFNGEIGTIVTIDRSELTPKIRVEMEGRIISYKLDEFNQITHAYAVSIHKSQGSEYPAVVIPVLTSHYIMLARNLVYTAVTRAKKLVILVGSKKAIGMAVNNDQATKRYTLLAQRLRGHL